MSRKSKKKLVRISLPFLALILGTAGILPAFLLITRLNSDEYWTTITPELVRMDSDVLDAMIHDVENNDYYIDSILVIRNGFIVAEWYEDPFNKNSIFEVYSVTKSVTSALIGIAIDKGYIESINELVLDFFPEKNISNIDAYKESMTIEHILTMTTGLNWSEGQDLFNEWYASEDHVKFVLDRPMIHAPGLVWNYNTGASHLLTAILERTTNMSTLDFANKYLFGPLSIRDAFWIVDPQGVAYGGNGLIIKPRDMAKLGFLFHKKGIWEGKRIISSSWVSSSTASQIILTINISYGYQWWIYPNHEHYQALGYGGQSISVFYKKELIVVFTCIISIDMIASHGVYLIDTYILPAIM
ncbi:MAG: serine hydrolase domain-containing protein [Promethearchaeota archaeon]